MLGKSISKNSLLLALFALVSAAVLAGLHESTKERINQQIRAASQRALFEIVPQSQHDNDLLGDTLPLPEDAWRALGLKQSGNMHIARKNGEIIAVILPTVAPDGYSGDISMIVGVNRDGSLAGVRVLVHHETPGLGDRIELKKSDWILGFAGKSLQNPAADHWKVKKDGGEFDQFTGATITPRAVVHQVKRVLEYVKAEEARLFPSAETTAELNDLTDLTDGETHHE